MSESRSLRRSAPALVAALVLSAFASTEGIADGITSYPGVGCRPGFLQTATPDTDGAIHGGDLTPVDLVCPLVTTAVEYGVEARVFLSTYRDNACTIRTVDPIADTVFATHVAHHVPLTPGLVTPAQPVELVIPHAFTAGPWAVRALSCTIPGFDPPISIPTLPGDGAGRSASIRSYSFESTSTPGPTARLEQLERLLAAQGEDPVWAIDRKDMLRALGEAGAGEGAAIAIGKVDCRATLCRVDYMASSRDAISHFERAALAEGAERIRESGRFDAWVEGEWAGTLFVSRDGFMLLGEKE